MATLAEQPMPEMTERLIFSTDILRPFQDEYRVWRRDPRTQIVYTLRMSNERFAAFEETLYDNITAADWVVPFWHERTGNLSLSSSQTVLSVDTNADYRVGGQAMVWQSCDTYELATIASVGSGQITISGGGLTASYTGAAVMPAHTCFIAAQPATRRAYRGVMDLEITFQLVETADLGSTAWTTYSGYEVMSCASGYLSELTGVIFPNVEYYGQDLGVVVQETTRDQHDTIFAAELSGKHWQVKQFLHQVRGRDYPFWIKAWGGQLEVAAASSGAGSIVVNTARAAADYTNRHIFIDGQYRQISSAVTNGATQTLTLDSVLSADVAAGAPTCLISLVRSDTDEIDIQHKHGYASNVSFAVAEHRSA